MFYEVNYGRIIKVHDSLLAPTTHSLAGNSQLYSDVKMDQLGTTMDCINLTPVTKSGWSDT